MSTTPLTPPDDPADALVLDLGVQPGAVAIQQPIDNSTLSLQIPSMTFDTSSSTNKKVFVWGLSSAGSTQNRYGTYTVGGQLGSNPVFSCQATNFVKKCKFVGFVGNTQTDDRDVYLRVYREIVPGAFNLYGDKRVTTPVLPRIGSNVPTDVNGKGSIPSSAFANGFYNVLFIGWKDYQGNKRFALVDWYAVTDPYHNFDQYKERVTNLSQGPAGSQANRSASGSSAFANNFITSQYNGGVQGGSSGRIPLPKIAGRTEASYYLIDTAGSQISQQQTSLPPRSTIAPKISRPTFTGSQLRLIDESDTSFKKAGDTYPYASSQSLKYSRFYVEHKGSRQQILVSGDNYTQLENYFGDIAKLAANATSLSTVDGIKLQPGVNWVPNNLDFETGTETSSNWGQRRRKDGETYFNGIVVGSSTAPFSAGVQTLDNTIEGTVTVGGVEKVLRTDYIYVLPGHKRANNAGSSNVTFVDNGKIGTALAAETQLNDVQACNKGRHAGKFLKSAGFTHTGVMAYAKGIETFLRSLEMKAVATQTFNGYFQGYGYPRYAGVGTDPAVSVGFQFSLQGYANLPVISGLPSSSRSSVSTTTTITKTDDIAAKYLKVINTKAGILSETGTVSLESLQQAIYFSARLGLPMNQFKEQTLKAIKDGKIAYLINKKKLTPARAEEEWKKDPLYLGLNKIFGSGGAGYSGSGSNAYGGNGGSNSGYNNSGQASKKNTNKKITKNQAQKNLQKNANTKTASSASETIKITVTRGLAGYRAGIRSTGQATSKPTLIQTYEGLRSSKQIDGTPIRSFVFPFVPNNVNYSGLGVNWTEIERTGSYPIVDWASFQLLKISFTFDIVSMAQENQAGFGLYYSCEDQIHELREMAQAPYPVTFLNMDKFMQDELRWPSLNSGRGVEFVIQEFSVTAVQRTSSNPTALVSSTMANQISRASCTMTLQEIPIEKVDIVQMPPMRPCKKECDKDKITTEKDSYAPLFTPIISRSTG